MNICVRYQERTIRTDWTRETPVSVRTLMRRVDYVKVFYKRFAIVRSCYAGPCQFPQIVTTLINGNDNINLLLERDQGITIQAVADLGGGHESVHECYVFYDDTFPSHWNDVEQ